MQFSMIRCLSLSHRHIYQGGSWLKEIMEKVLACQGQSWKIMEWWHKGHRMEVKNWEGYLRLKG